ncbi:MAG: thioredoxin [Actinomycetia bacterium]|nr:thioredoxin [Actinomycetes bacterium]MCP4959754.1 thioredoxin [Actinomycetes bacterium]
MTAPELPDGLVAFVKRDCPTCVTVGSALAHIQQVAGLTVYTQDDPSFPSGVEGVIHDGDLANSWHHDIETVPTLLKVSNGAELDRIVGWSRTQWTEFTGVDDFDPDLPEWRPGCGSLSVDPNLVDELRARFSGSSLKSRRVELAVLEDEIEAMYDRGWSDGLPLVPPTEARVLAMLEGTWRSPDEVVATVPPDLVDVTVEKVAINAVMAGCKPEYLPVVLAAIEAACTDSFNMHGLLATTMPVGPVVVVSGPIAERIGMNSGRNVMGQGNRANSTIGRALQLVVRNVGGGRPGEVDRAAHGQPGKLSFCFAEDEAGSPWEPLSTDFGHAPETSTVTLFAGEGARCIVDQLSRDPESLARSLAQALIAMHHHKLVIGFDAMIIVGPEHVRVFEQAGWTKTQTRDRIIELTKRDGAELVRGAGGIDEGLPEAFADATAIPKVGPDGLILVHAGGGAGMFSELIGGWVNGATGSAPTSRPIH